MSKKSVPVAQYDGKNLIAKYASMKTAAKITGAQSAHIGKVVNGIRNTAGGYRWKATRLKNTLSKKNPGVVQKDKNGNILAIYANPTIASEYTGVKEAKIVAVMEGASKSAGGYIWE